MYIESMKYNQELHELTNELDDCYNDIFHSSNLGNIYNSNLRFAVANYRIEQIRESQSNSRTYYNNDLESKKLDKLKEIESNISKRAIKLTEIFNDDLILSKFPSELWFIIAQYEGGVETCLLGRTLDSFQDNSNYSWCEIM